MRSYRQEVRMKATGFDAFLLGALEEIELAGAELDAAALAERGRSRVPLL